MDPTRGFVKSVKRVVVKVGTAVATRSDGRLALGRLGALCEQLKEQNNKDYEVMLVTSGAVGLGRQRLRYRRLVNSRVLRGYGQVVNGDRGVTYTYKDLPVKA